MRSFRYVPVAAALVAAPLAAAPAIHFGQWEMTMTSKMEGLGMAMPGSKTTIRHCITADNLVPKDPKAEKKCTYGKPVVTGNKVRATFECRDDQTHMKGETEMTYTGDTCSGRMTVVMDVPGRGTMTMNTTIEGRRLGPCQGDPHETSIVESPEQKAGREAAGRARKDQASRESQTAALAAVKVPKVAPGAIVYLRPDGGLNAPLALAGPKLDLREGEWEIVEETATVMGDHPSGGATARPVRVCLSPSSPLPPGLQQRSCHGVAVQRTGNILGWKISCSPTLTEVDGEGGLEFHGDTFTGAVVVRMKTAAGMTMTQYSRITGRRVGDKKCETGRAQTGRGGTGRAGTSAPAKSPGQNLKEKALERFKGLFGR